MNRKKKLGWWKHIDFMLIDLLCIQIAYLAAYFFRHQTMRIYRETSLYAHAVSYTHLTLPTIGLV